MHVCNFNFTVDYRFNNHTMMIQSVQPEDAGDYTCSVLGYSSSDTKQVTHSVQLYTEPKIVKMLPEGNNRLVPKGSPLRVQCIASGIPKPTIQWSRAVILLELIISNVAIF